MAGTSPAMTIKIQVEVYAALLAAGIASTA